MDRRQFLRLLAASALQPALAIRRAGAAAPNRLLVLLELKGGADDLAMFPPLACPAYRTLRPNIAIGPRGARPLSSSLGLHPALGALADSWERGELALVQNVGSPEPDLSHFCALQQWETGAPNDPSATLGWVARSYAFNSDGNEDLVGVSFGLNSGPLRGPALRVLEFSGDVMVGQGPQDVSGCVDERREEREESAIAHLCRVMRDRDRAHDLAMTDARIPLVEPSFLDDPLARVLRQVIALMQSPRPPTVYKLTVEGFDTHTDQHPRLEKLLFRLGSDLAAFRACLRALGLWSRVMVATTSEFGRRVKENGAHGTDHGTASTALVMSGDIHGGFYGDAPFLDVLDANGNRKVTVDFRRYLNTLARWSFADGRLPFDAAAFPTLPLLRA
jgi:uncharacterized protein (DUF1501 family)